MKKATIFCGIWECPFEAVRRRRRGKDKHRRARNQAQVSDPGQEPVYAVRASEGIHAAFQAVPYLFPRIGSPGHDPWCNQIQLVIS